MSSTKLIAATLTAGALSAAALTASASSASALACFPNYEILHSGTSIYGIGSAYCDPPGVDNPRPVTIQRRVNSTTWVTVTPTKTGTVRYQCTGTSTRTYRLMEAKAMQVTAPCT